MPTLTQTTALEWFAFYKRVFQYGVDLDYLTKNPFERMRGIVRGKPSIKRRAFTDEEAKLILARSGELEGSKRWLPFLALYHGARLSELAAMPRADFRGDHFDINGQARRLKTETAERLVPLHPAALAFKAHTEGLTGEWLFADLDHDSAHGPGHEFSKWFGAWLDEIGLSDPAITFHSFRHYWKRRARISPVKEEVHDVLSGHKGVNSVSRNYGAGADIEPLKAAMSQIEFPIFGA